MPKAIKFINTFFDSGVPKYEEGKTYAASEETQRQAALGNAEEVTVKASEISEVAIDSEKSSDVAQSPDA